MATIRKRIALEIKSPSPNLSGINAAIGALKRLNAEISVSNVLASELSVIFGKHFGTVGGSASKASAAISQVGASQERVNRAISEAAKLDPSGKYASRTQIFAKGEGKPAFQITTQKPSAGMQIVRREQLLGADAGVTTVAVTHTPDAAQKAADAAAAKRAHIEQVIPAREREGAIAEQLKVEEALRERGVAQAERNIKARALRRARLERDINKEILAAKRKFQTELSALEAKYGRTSSTSQNVGKSAANVAARQAYMADLARIRSRPGIGLNQQSEIEALSHAANLGVVARSGPPVSGWRKMLGGNGRWLDRGLKSWTPEGLLKNTMTAGGWMVAVGAFMKVTETIEHSIKKMMELQLKTAVLRQTFRGVGGTANELADDVLKLAAAEGRGSEEAMKAAIQWTRLGLDRRQAAEATRVSLVAANVAEMTAHEATEKLSSVMATYNLQASELNGTLGMLAKTSQTYRVTTGELLDGISRVSNIAKESGMNFAELQGIMGALVQKTGLSGERVANAMQIFLNRINNPGVQEYFERRYNTQLTGNAADFGKIRDIFLKASNEERKLIGIQVGTPRQSNVFTAMMEVYPEMRKAAIASLSNIDAAMEENIKVTNTAHAAIERFKSSWDRLVNSPAADHFIGRNVNVLSGMIQGIGNSFGTGAGPKKPIYFDPSKANWKGVLAGAVAYGPLAKSADYVSKYFGGASLEEYANENLGISNEPTSEGDVFQKEAERIQIHANKAEAHRLSAEEAKERGDKERESRELGMAKQEASIAKSYQEAQIKRLNAALAITKTESEQLPILSELNEAQRKLVRLNYDQAEVIDRTEKKMEQMTRVMTEHRLLGQDIAGTLRNIGLPNWVEDYVATAGQLAMTMQMLKGAETDAAKPGSNPDLYSQTIIELQRAKLGLEMRQKYFDSAKGSFYVKAASDVGVASRMATDEIEGHGVGYTRGEQLLDRRRWLAQEKAKFSHLDKMNASELVRAAAVINSLKTTELQIAERLYKIDRERQQVMIETQREFQKSLVTAGPGEILRKLATAGMMKGGKMGAGQFFSMAPDMRSDAYTLMGGEGMAKLNWEKRALAGQQLSVPAMQGLARAGEADMERIGTVLSQKISAGADSATVIASRMAAAEASARAISSALANAARSANASTAYAPTADPVPQAMPLTRGATVTDFSRRQAWQPNAAQRAAMASAGITD